MSGFTPGRALRRRRSREFQPRFVMCGRFTYKLTWEELVRLYGLTMDQPARNTQARFNVCPTDPIDTVIECDGARGLVPMRWGLIPRWWSKPIKELKAATFNARAETVGTKPFFRDVFQADAVPNSCIGIFRVANDAGRQTALVLHGA